MKLSMVIAAIAIASFAGNTLAWTVVKDFNFGEADDIAISSESGFNDIAGASTIVKQSESPQHVPTLEGFSAVELNIREGETGFGAWGGDIYFPEYVRKGEELWVQLHIYIPSDFLIQTNTGHLKFMRMRNITPQPDGGLKVTGHLDTLIQNEGSTRGTFSLLKEGQSSVIHIGDIETQQVPRDRWVKIEEYVYLDDVAETNGGNAVVRVWMDNKLVGEANNIPTITDAGSYYSRMLLFTYWNGAAPKTQKLYLDYITMSTDRPNEQDENGNYFLGDILGRPVMQ